MKINIRWKDMSENSELELFLEEKVQKIFEFKFVEGDVKSEFTYFKSNKSYKVSLNVEVHKAGTLRSEATSSNPKESITEAVHKIIDQLRRHKTKINGEKH